MSPEFELDRRSLVAGIAALIGAASLPAEAFAAPKRGAKRFFTPGQAALVAAVADTLIPATDTPGALAAKVPELLDGLMRNWASLKTRTALTAAFAAIDQAATASDGKSYAALSPERRKAVLAEFERGALKTVPRKDKLTGLAAILAPPSVADPGYYQIKNLVLSLYYNSQIAMTQELIYTHNPGKYQPSVKITPETRPEAGGGLGG